MTIRKWQVDPVRVENLKKQLLELYREMSDRERAPAECEPDAAPTDDRLVVNPASGRMGPRAWRTTNESTVLYGRRGSGISCADALIVALQLVATALR